MAKTTTKRSTKAAKKPTAAKATTKTARKKQARRAYTKADIKELRAHSKARTPLSKMAKLFNRTEGSLRQKALKLGLGLGHRR